LDTQRLREADIEKLIGDCDYQKFLNTRNGLYRTGNMKDQPPVRAEAVRLMEKEPNLIRRPVVIRGEEIVLGYDEEAFRKLVRKRAG
jgi:arsenate reductase